MKRNLLIFSIFALLGLLSLPFPVVAHHGTVEYETKTITLMGTVTDYEFTNPHILIHIDVPESNGDYQHWVVETSPPSLAMHAGWTKNMMKRGDMISYMIRPAKNGAMIGRGGSQVTINGKTLGE